MREKNRSGSKGRIRGGSVLQRLTLSYVVLIMVLALVIGLSSHAISSRNYNTQVADLNQRLLNRYATIVNDSVIKEAQRVHQDLCLNLTLKTSIEVLFEKDYDIVKVKRLHNELLKIVSASGGRIEAIHIRSVPNDFHISSIMGYKDNSEINRKTLPNLYWSANADQKSERAIWMPARTIHYSSVDKVNVVSYIATYPATQPFSKAKGIITIDLKEDYVRSVLGRVSPQDTRQLFIADRRGSLITHDSHAIPGTMTDLGYGEAESLLAKDWDNRVMVLPDGERMTSRISLSNGWVLMQSMPLKEFHAVSRTIALTNTTLSLLAVLLCILISRQYALRIHLPLANITERIKTLLRQGDTEHPMRNEYAIIDQALSELQSQLLSLSGVRERNIPLLREKLLHGLLGGTVRSRNEYEHLLQQIGINPDRIGTGTVVVLMDWSHPADSREGEPDTVTEEMVRRLMDRLTLELFPGERRGEGFLLGALTSETGLAMLVVSGESLPGNRCEALLTDAQEILGVSAVVAVGSRRETPFEAGRSAQDATHALEYRFFHPGRHVFDIEDYPFPEEDEDQELSRQLARYADCLKTNDLGCAEQVIGEITRWMGEAELSAGCRRQGLRDATRVLYEVARSFHISAEDPVFQIRNPLEQLPDVHAFKTWWLQATSRLLELKQNTSRHTTDDMVDSIIRYIAGNLSSELSLTRLSEYTSLSKSYISHIFKESTGINIINYITDQRMAEARKLLLNNSVNIETIARRIGYETPHYFSKKFRQYYGVTPSAYRLEHLQGKVQPDDCPSV